MTNEKIYVSDIAKIEFKDDGIFHYVLKPSDKTYDLQEVLNQKLFFDKLTGGKRYKLLIDTRQTLAIETDESFENHINNLELNPNIFALVYNSLPMQISLRRLFSKNVPNKKYFKDYDEAYKWLKDYEL
ncbi:hypothetical protein [Brumimicrobium aurantiacum]|uniref:STAS/SEC14 domain-containing protein n=1 Tax=Brumimicrobium aurantiacum TaxID=1737063 RepID=A0A3E1EUJ0_9FLAO|nr:hypothetical protein [Brumimicrobium aurantiacum]RFC53200.1 hypothetical protein DXU93_14125 [Brumimicrobium aurantiacum]